MVFFYTLGVKMAIQMIKIKRFIWLARDLERIAKNLRGDSA